LACVTLR